MNMEATFYIWLGFKYWLSVSGSDIFTNKERIKKSFFTLAIHLTNSVARYFW